jgi:hypothetical protein
MSLPAERDINEGMPWPSGRISRNCPLNQVKGINRKTNQFAFPREDERGPQDGAWLVGCIERAQGQLASVRFDRP